MSEKTNTDLAKQELSCSERFTNSVIKEFNGINNDIAITDHQRKLIAGYFLKIDSVLKKAETKRDAGKVAIPYTWNNVDMAQLAQDLVVYAQTGMDMMQDNMLTPIPYQDKRTGKHVMSFTKGYNGIKYLAEKYALIPYKNVVVELVYETDTFVALKKSDTNDVEGYKFEINNPFERGKIIGGFGYIAYSDSTKNKLIIMSKAALEKRKPKYASKQFWGEGQDGWYEEMMKKTLVRHVYGTANIPLDPDKTNALQNQELAQEIQIADLGVQDEIANNANVIDIDSVSPPVEIESAEDVEAEDIANETIDVADMPTF